MPERFGLSYTGADNAEHTPVMIHRAMFGSYERFIGILIEHYAGELPLWLAPRAGDRAARLRPLQRLRARGAPSELAGRGRARRGRRPLESVGRKIREAELRKVPYMLIVGEREQDVADGLRARAPRRRRGRERRSRTSREDLKGPAILSGVDAPKTSERHVIASA